MFVGSFWSMTGRSSLAIAAISAAPPISLVPKSRNLQYFQVLTGTHRHSKALKSTHGNPHNGLKMG